MGFKLPKQSIIHGTKGHKKAVEAAKASPAKGLLDNLQTGLTAAGMVPALGNVADIVNVGISGARAGYAKYKGDTEGAKKHTKEMALNAAAAVPGAGLAVGGAKLTSKAVKGVKTLKAADKTEEATKAVKEGQKLKKTMKTAENVTDTTTAAGMTDRDLQNRKQAAPPQPKDKNVQVTQKGEVKDKKESKGKVSYDQAWEKADKSKYASKEEFTKEAKAWNKKQAEKKQPKKEKPVDKKPVEKKQIAKKEAPKKEAPKKQKPKTQKPKIAKNKTPKKKEGEGLFKKNKA
tara:strand:+ start:204 stop:1070 length:867 start_codon:yes stop_codon:yes gene_type:complete